MLREKEPNGALEQALGHLYQSENVPAGAPPSDGRRAG